MAEWVNCLIVGKFSSNSFSIPTLFFLARFIAYLIADSYSKVSSNHPTIQQFIYPFFFTLLAPLLCRSLITASPL